MPGLVKINYYSCVMSAGARQITPIVGVGSRPHALLKMCLFYFNDIAGQGRMQVFT